MEPWTTAGLGDGRMELRSDNGEELLAALNGLPESAKTVKHVVWHLMKKEENENENENENKNEKEKEKDGRQLAASQEAQDRGLQVLALCSEVESLEVRFIAGETSKTPLDSNKSHATRNYPSIDNLKRLPFLPKLIKLLVHQMDYSPSPPDAPWLSILADLPALEELTFINCHLNIITLNGAKPAVLSRLQGVCIAFDSANDSTPAADTQKDWEAFIENYVRGIASLECAQSIEHLLLGFRYALDAWVNGEFHNEGLRDSIWLQFAKWWNIAMGGCPNVKTVDGQLEIFISPDGRELNLGNAACWPTMPKLEKATIRATGGFNMIQALRDAESLLELNPTIKQFGFHMTDPDPKLDADLNLEDVSDLVGVELQAVEPTSSVLGFTDDA
ncbi:MAG: hypothetical protein CYPHOPRED_002152 [Cyphobasidiales sp. Tagirdzhanova-0007]|nr:MAG: hypothetical protein CYPHOPRED_002152 [Cyphobasidiales sp. Tagirdzhanova-0007]